MNITNIHQEHPTVNKSKHFLPKNWSLLQFCCSRHFLLACSNLSQFLGRKCFDLFTVGCSWWMLVIFILLSAGMATRSLTQTWWHKLCHRPHICITDCNGTIYNR
jgi:hypothetical protein